MNTITVEFPDNYTITQDVGNRYLTEMFDGAEIVAVDGNAVTITSDDAEEIADKVMRGVSTYEPKYVGIRHPDFYKDVRGWYGAGLSDSLAHRTALDVMLRGNNRLMINFPPLNSGEKIRIWEA